MPYSRGWSAVVEATPLGSADPGTIDDRIREKMVDVRERMNDVVTDWTADPVVPKPQKRTGVKLVISAQSTSSLEDQDDVTWTGQYVESDNTLPNSMFLNVPVMSFWRITSVKVLVDKNTASSMTLELHRMTFSTAPVDSTIATAAISTTGLQISALFAGAELTAGFFYFLKSFSPDNRFRVYSVEVTYDEV